MTHAERFLLAGVMGFPVMHSRSPRLHNYWLARHGLAGAYLPLAVPREDLVRLCVPFPRSVFPAAT